MTKSVDRINFHQLSMPAFGVLVAGSTMGVGQFFAEDLKEGEGK